MSDIEHLYSSWRMVRRFRLYINWPEWKVTTSTHWLARYLQKHHEWFVHLGNHMQVCNQVHVHHMHHVCHAHHYHHKHNHNHNHRPHHHHDHDGDKMPVPGRFGYITIYIYVYIYIMGIVNIPGATYPPRNSRPYDQGLWKPVGFP